MDPFLDTPFLLDDPHQASHTQPHETWKLQQQFQPTPPQQQPQQSQSQQQQQQPQQSQPQQHAPHHRQHHSMTQLDADAAFFAGPALSSNALGLLASYDAPVSPTSQPASIGMVHSHSMPSFEFHGSDMAHMPPQFQMQAAQQMQFVNSMHHQMRRSSVSNLSDASGLSGASSGAPSHYDENSPRAFTPSQSPLPLGGLSGLALGAPATPARVGGSNEMLGENLVGRSPFGGSQHDVLLSLSQGHDIEQQQHSGRMGPPALKRRVTGLGHSAYTGGNHGNSSNVDDDTTPMPPSLGQFQGQRPASLSLASGPLTPQHTVNRTSIGSAGSVASQPTPGQSHSSSTTPEDSFRGFGDFDSPFNPLQRLSRDDLDTLSYDRSLEAMWEEKEKSQMAQHHQQLFGTPAGMVANLSLHNGSPASLGSAMSRGMSAPMRNQVYAPMTPAAYQQRALPCTPNGAHPSPYDAAYSAPMMASRSMSSFDSPTSVSPINIVDGRRRESISGGSTSQGGVTRTATPRSRARNTGPPPLIVSSADKMHVCHCGKRFKRMEHLKRHNRTHTQERPHRCPVESCGKWFGRTDNLAQHLKTHFRTVGGRSAELLALTTGDDSLESPLTLPQPLAEPRHDPHAAASAAAAAASKVAAAAANKRRDTASNDVLGGPISLARPQGNRTVLTPSGSLSTNSSPGHGPIDTTWTH